MEKGQKAVVRVVALKKVSPDSSGYYIVDIYESHDFDSSFTYKDGKLKAAIAHRIVDGLEALDMERADKLEIHLIKEEE